MHSAVSNCLVFFVSSSKQPQPIRCTATLCGTTTSCYWLYHCWNYFTTYEGTVQLGQHTPWCRSFSWFGGQCCHNPQGTSDDYAKVLAYLENYFRQLTYFHVNFAQKWFIPSLKSWTRTVVAEEDENAKDELSCKLYEEIREAINISASTFSDIARTNQEVLASKDEGSRICF